MFDSFANAFGENLADILTYALFGGIVLAGVLYWWARKRRTHTLRERLRGPVSVPGAVRETLAKMLNLDTAEVAAIGAVTFVDVAWHYSMADPQIWDHFQGPAADHISDVLQNLEVLKSSLGDAPVVHNILDYFHHLEATQVFHDIWSHLPALDGAGDSTAIVLDAKSQSVVSTLVDAGTAVDIKATVAGKAVGLVTHIPYVTIGFATYRAWQRSQKGAALGRNVEFAAIEIATRAGGGLAGGQLGGALGTLIVPGVGTIVGSVAGAVAGAIGGALLGEELKQRHIRKAQTTLNQALEELGRPPLTDPQQFHTLTDLFVERERQYTTNLLETRRRLRRYSLLPWRIVWPDEKLVLLQETVRMAEEKLGEVKEGTVEAVERLQFMRDTEQYRRMGIILWSDPALCRQITCDGEQVAMVEDANNTLRRELTQLGRLPEPAMSG